MGSQVRKQSGCTGIAHISDLHYTLSSPLGRAPWAELQQDLREQRGAIDAIVVTGDVIDGSLKDWSLLRISKAFRAVSEFLNGLCEAAEISPEALMVIPGNHDSRLKGFLPFSLKKAFCKVFTGASEPRHLPDLRLFVYPFDSNLSRWKGEQAAGEVAQEDFVRMRRVIDETKPADCFRVALLHHHPMPIAATEHRSLENMEEFLLLRNAGMFMTEVLRANFDLVLHGHKHFPCASKTVYLEEGAQRSVAVVASGSSGAAVEHPTYNLISLSDSGRIELRRRIRTGATYLDDRQAIELRTYAEARQIRYERLSADPELKLDINHYERCDVIEPTGDVKILENYRGVTSVTSEPVAEQAMYYGTASGYFVDPKHTPTSIGWRWGETLPDKPIRIGYAIFDPPVGQTPIDFQRERLVPNAFHFSQRDRREATVNAEDEEEIGYRVELKMTSFVLVAIFPEQYFPATVRLQITGAKTRVRDPDEETFCQAGLTLLPASRTVVLNVANPLPWYRYALRWPLPPEDPLEPDIQPTEIGTSEEALKKLLDGSDDPVCIAAVRTVIDLLRGELEKEELRPGGGTLDLDIALFARTTDNGLRCLYSNIADPKDPILSRAIPSGRDVVGLAYKRRTAILYTPHVKELGYLRAEQPLKTAVFAIPLTYPFERGRRVLVVSLATSSNSSPLLRLADDVDLRDLVALKVRTWWQHMLFPALGLFENIHPS
jgi:3',5'-cyclic AMP phosphodiesterase CpdA